MIDLDAWGGAQWVLATWMMLSGTVFPAIGAYYRSSQGSLNKEQHAGFWMYKIISAVTLFAVLSWGGFWS